MLHRFNTVLLVTLNNIVGVKSAPYGTLFPFFHIPMDPGGLTILVCVFNDALNRDAGISWIRRGTSGSGPVMYNVVGEEESTFNVFDPTSMQSVGPPEWNTYTCFLSHRRPAQFMHSPTVGLQTDDKDTQDMCSKHQSDLFNDIQIHTDLLIIYVLRIIFFKITVFNVLMTAQAVIK
ncbi:uncharacterized protein LOC143509368 [Brachyhypopomus gauderio]|uniref:uncharacterized protein LOC143509368 n=1 Tax=Brachyhypopomus gauderio TaxID=698409 RepID=UPI00404125C9